MYCRSMDVWSTQSTIQSGKYGLSGGYMWCLWLWSIIDDNFFMYRPTTFQIVCDWQAIIIFQTRMHFPIFLTAKLNSELLFDIEFDLCCCGWITKYLRGTCFAVKLLENQPDIFFPCLKWLTKPVHRVTHLFPELFRKKWWTGK